MHSNAQGEEFVVELPVITRDDKGVKTPKRGNLIGDIVIFFVGALGAVVLLAMLPALGA